MSSTAAFRQKRCGMLRESGFSVWQESSARRDRWGRRLCAVARMAGLAKHLQHPVGDQEAADDVRHRGKQRDRAQNADRRSDNRFPSP